MAMSGRRPRPAGTADGRPRSDSEMRSGPAGASPTPGHHVGIGRPCVRDQSMGRTPHLHSCNARALSPQGGLLQRQPSLAAAPAPMSVGLCWRATRTEASGSRITRTGTAPAEGGVLYRTRLGRMVFAIALPRLSTPSGIAS